MNYNTSQPMHIRIMEVVGIALLAMLFIAVVTYVFVTGHVGSPI